jgi:hypothetical protein
MITNRSISRVFAVYIIVMFLLTGALRVQRAQAESLASPLYASGDFVWAKSMGGPSGASGDRSFGVAVDANSNVYTIGSFNGTVDFDPGPGTSNLTSVGGEDIFISTLDNSGNFIWARSIGGTGIDVADDVALDSSGNIYATGFFSGIADFDPGAGTAFLTSAGNFEIFVSKFDSSGNFVWAKSMGGPGEDRGYSLAADASGNVYLTGTFSGSADFDPGVGTTNLNSNGLGDIFVSKLDSSGDFAWAKSTGSGGIDAGQGLAVDASGNVYTTGYFGGNADFDPGAGVAILTHISSLDIFVSKLDTSGNFAWAKGMGAWSDDRGHSIAVDSNGNVYTTGYFGDTVDFDPGAGTANLISTGSADIFFSKLDGSGNFAWAKILGGTNYDLGNSIIVDASGNVYTTGSFEFTADFDPSAGTSNLVSAGSYEIFISKLDSSGNFVWAKRMGGTNYESGRAIALDSTGNIFTTGEYNGTADFDPGTGIASLTSAGGNDIFVSKLENDGIAPTVDTFTAASPLSSLAIPITAFTASDNVGVTGYMVTESSTAPSSGDLGWAGTAPTTYTVASDGSYTLYPWAKDAAGNVSSVFGSPASVTVDTTPPTLSSIVRANTNPTNLASVDFTVTFSESVTGVDISDFALTTTGVAGASVTGVSGAGATYTVSVGTGSGDGTIRLDVVDDDSILDAASNSLNGGFTGGEIYNVDKNDAPSSLSLDNTSVAGNLPAGTLVGTFSSTDVDIADTFTYSLVPGMDSADNASFSIAGDQLQTAAVFDSAVKTSYAIRVRTTDNGVGNLSFEQAFTITVTANNVTPSLLAPVNLELLTINRPTFDWTDVLGSINYHIQINKSSGFTKSGKVLDTTTTSSTFTPSSDLPTGITLYWRVSRNTAAGAGPWSGIRSFTIARPPDVPGPLSPKSNSKNISLTPSLDWSDSTPFAGTTLLKYELQISTDPAFPSPSINTVDSNYTPTMSLSPNTKYYWHVRACNNLGQCSAWSTLRNFTTIP